MLDTLYQSNEIDPEVRPIFEQLQTEFGRQYEIWVRRTDFGREISAGILNHKSIAVVVSIKKDRRIRNKLSQVEIDKINKYLTSDAMEDLIL